jgi:RimJ/RimL family protein N-acetyltransferase
MLFTVALSARFATSPAVACPWGTGTRPGGGRGRRSRVRLPGSRVLALDWGDVAAEGVAAKAGYLEGQRDMDIPVVRSKLAGSSGRPHSTRNRAVVAISPPRPLVAAEHGRADGLGGDQAQLCGNRLVGEQLGASNANAAYIAEMLERCDRGWQEASGAFFSIRDSTSHAFLGYGAAIRLQLAARQGELGFMVAPHARGQGVATRTLKPLTDWCFKELGLIRLELRINTRNEASVNVAAANGYRLEGVLRSVHLKRDQRVELGIWSRLWSDPELAVSQ